MKKIKIIGGGLAGPEAALQAARRGCEVDLYEMRPTRSTEAHQTGEARDRMDWATTQTVAHSSLE